MQTRSTLPCDSPELTPVFLEAILDETRRGTPFNDELLRQKMSERFGQLLDYDGGGFNAAINLIPRFKARDLMDAAEIIVSHTARPDTPLVVILAWDDKAILGWQEERSDTDIDSTESFWTLRRSVIKPLRLLIAEGKSFYRGGRRWNLHATA